MLQTFILLLPGNKQPGDYKSFTGCIKDITIEATPLDLSIFTAMYGEAMHGCGVPKLKIF